MEKTDIKIISKLINGETRYIVVSAADESVVIDDAQGYGYKKYENAIRAYNYKTRDISKDTQFNRVCRWAKKNADLIDEIDSTHADNYVYAMKCGVKAPGMTLKWLEAFLTEKGISLPENISVKDLQCYLKSSRTPRGNKKKK